MLLSVELVEPYLTIRKGAIFNTVLRLLTLFNLLLAFLHFTTVFETFHLCVESNLRFHTF